NPTLTNIGLGLQKWAIDNKIHTSESGKGALFVSVWCFGLLLQLFVFFLAFKALSIGNASTLGGFAGFGLVVLTLFSFAILKEHILKQEMLGMTLILTGTASLGFFSSGHQSAEVIVHQQSMLVFFMVYFAFAAAGIFLLFKNLRGYGGAIFGLFGGSTSGLAMVFLKIVTHLPGMKESLLSTMIHSPYTWLMAIGGVGGMALVQIGYKFGKAIQVVPCFSSMVVIIPTIAGISILGESVPTACILSVVVITSGVILTTTAAPAAARRA
ncbi:MAG TPA: hypothetical protein PLQ76_08560, partial [bacterium]|nr:hypothetical protein [bacterium]